MRTLAMLLLVAVGPAWAQPVVKEFKGFVVSVDDTKLTVSNVAVGTGGGQTFVMPAPKAGEPAPTWVAQGSDAKSAESKPKMRMMTMSPGDKPLELLELTIAKGTVAIADFPAGKAVLVTYREADGKKQFVKIEARTPEP